MVAGKTGLAIMIGEIKGDLLKVDVEIIVNPWNRNIIPWWLLMPQGVSGAIKRQAGYKPFIELAAFGAIPLGEARITSAGRLPYRAIIHVAGINMFWIATEYSVRSSVKNAIILAAQNGFNSMAVPLIGSGSGNRGKAWSKLLIMDELQRINSAMEVVVVEYGQTCPT